MKNRRLSHSVDQVLIFSSNSLLLDLPPELQSMIASELDAVSLCNLKLVCKSLDTWTKDPPKLSSSEWQQFHSMFETMARRRRRKLQTLGCSDCRKVLDKGVFSDRAAIRSLLNKNGRICISCGIKNGSKRDFKIKGEAVFGCRGCQKAKPLEEEDKCLVDKARWYEDFPEVGEGSFDASRGFRWCHDCWSIVKNYRSLDHSP